MAQKFYETVIEYLVKYGFQVLGGILILVIGLKLAQWVAKMFTDFAQKKHWDITLTQFISGVIKAVILVFASLMALEKFGVTISPLIASVSAMIFGASFAIQAPLSNYAAGLMVIVTRPFTVGNNISVQGVSGVVHDIKLPCTVIISPDGGKITIPNKDIVGQILYNSAEKKLIEKTVGISYGDSPEKAIQIIQATLKASPKVVQNPPPQVGIENFGESSIDISMRYWVPTSEYYLALFSVNLAIFRALQEAKITIPFPQREVRMVTK